MSILFFGFPYSLLRPEFDSKDQVLYLISVAPYFQKSPTVCNVLASHSPDLQRNNGAAGDEPNRCKKEENCTDNGNISNGLVSRNCEDIFDKLQS